MKKGLSVCIVLGVLLAASFSSAVETYTFNISPFIAWVPYIVAKEQGFWENRGIKVEFIEYASMSESKEAAHQRLFADFVHMPAANIAEPQKAGVSDVVYLGTLSVADRQRTLILRNDLIETSLTGQIVGTFIADSAGSFFLNSYLKRVDTNLADVRIVIMNLDALEANFIHNRLQVVLTMDRKNRFYEKAHGVLVASTHDFYEPQGLAFMRKDGITAIPQEDLKNILRGCVDAIEWIRDPANWEDYKALLKRTILKRMPDLSDEQIREIAGEMKFVDPQRLLEHNQQKLPELFTELRAFWAAERLLPEDVLKEFTYSRVIYNQPLIEVLQEYAH